MGGVDLALRGLAAIPAVRHLIELALDEDLGRGDVTSQVTVGTDGPVIIDLPQAVDAAGNVYGGEVGPRAEIGAATVIGAGAVILPGVTVGAEAMVGAGAVVTRDELLEKVWGYEAMPTTRTVDNHLAALRAKLERDAADPQHLITVHGVGYKLVK